MHPEEISRKRFEQWVEEAWRALPPQFQERLENVDVVIEEWPSPAALRRAGMHHPAQLLGLYQGVPLSRRGARYNLQLPDKISLYRRPILMRARRAEEVPALIAHVLRHEIAHYFGIDDLRLKELGAY
ncbi:MAG: metallopeptidase family protein [Anaerolineae bacterium]